MSSLVDDYVSKLNVITMYQYNFFAVRGDYYLADGRDEDGETDKLETCTRPALSSTPSSFFCFIVCIV